MIRYFKITRITKKEYLKSLANVKATSLIANKGYTSEVIPIVNNNRIIVAATKDDELTIDLVGGEVDERVVL